MKVRMPSWYAASSTSMIASSSWKRIDWARAFSSDMWLTPKNWLSPKRTRSIATGATSGNAACIIDSSEKARPHAGPRRWAGVAPGGDGRGGHVAEQAGDHPVGIERGGEAVLAVEPAH